MEVALAVITLTTAVKDIVELGQRIHESFAKVQDNLRNAQRVAEDIKEMVEEINTFCDAHKDTLDNMKDFHGVLLGLLGKFRSFETSVLPLLSQPGGRRRDRLIRGWNAWRNNNSIERKISDLQSDMVTVMRRFVWKSTMRAEVKLETIHHETSKGLAALEDVRRDMYALRITAAVATVREPFEPSGATGDEFNRNIVLFAQSTPSTSVPMLRTPDVITEELMTAAYIKFQINAIAMIIARISAPPAFTLSNGTLDNTIGDFRVAHPLAELSMSLTHLRHHIVRQVTVIRDHLANRHIHTVSIYEGSIALNNLAYGLQELDMHHEALLVGKWAIMLAHIIRDACDGGRHDFSGLLALCQLNQTRRYRNSGDMTQALQSIKEAYTITRNLRNQFSTAVNSGFHVLHASILRCHAELLVDCRHSIQMLVEAITTLESVIGVQAFTYCELHANISLVVQPSSFFFDDLFSSSLTTTINEYVYALKTLGFLLFIAGHHEGALDLVLLAVVVCQKLVSIRGPEHRVDLALTLSSLVQSEVASRIPAEQLVNMANDCIQLLQELAEKNPLPYAHQLVDVLSKKASVLESLNQDSEALAAWEEAAGMAEQIVQDSTMHANALDNLSDHFRRLRRYDDAVRTGKLAITTHQDADEALRAIRYFHLSEDLQWLGRYEEAVKAARTSVTLYRRLTMMNPSRWTADLAESLSELAYGLTALGDYLGVLVVWRESASILDNLLNANFDTSHIIIATYCAALVKYMTISPFLKNEEDRHHVSSTAFRYCQHISEIYPRYPQNADIFADLSDAQWYCAYNMLHIGCLQEADQYIDHWVNVWTGKLAVFPESIRMEWHTTMITLKSRVLCMQGCTEEALLAVQTSRLSANALLFVCPAMIVSMVFEAQIQLDLGNTKEALQVAEEALQISVHNEQELEDITFVKSLHAVAFSALLYGNYALSIEAAQRGTQKCATSTSGDWQNHEGEYHSRLRPSLLAILSSAEANLGRYCIAVEYAHHAVNASLDIGGKWNVSAMTAEASYMETRGNLAEVLLATGDAVNARQICEERRAYFSERVEKRMGEYRDLAPILRMLGILCCAEGRHEDGEAAAQELSDIMKKLRCAFPSLQEQVKIRLRRQANMPILKILNDMTQKLECQHQVEVSSLYEVQPTS